MTAIVASDSLFDLPVQHVAVNGVDIAYRQAGTGPVLLLLHGHPQTHVMWHKLWPSLTQRFTCIAADLRGYGDSEKPQGGDDHHGYSKRVMAQDLASLMTHLGHERFQVLAHDRGARVAHRLALDHAARVDRMMLLDIAPTLDMYDQTTRGFAQAYFHWFFLIQPAPLPDRMVEADPVFYIRSVMGGRHAGLAPFTDQAMAEYERCVRKTGWAYAICEDYRASASIDLDHDRDGRASGEKVQCPLRVLWGAKGVVARHFDVLKLWQAVANDVDGHPVECGHYLAEEAPDLLLPDVLAFFKN
ncbi:alpha/beta fold hydrolase [Pigmentiphaga litoralis]|uniref:Haloacetate dehalogenase n=1 Tax=Pigmentiphaga litoralis TaxID=516702 RepID=A0A7Y9ISA7_9BURK|nr:alpha/beta hydrolase [Pigmentiphaga litoralis]NYE24297.1 haloacetate dehalogenase [Pigmentiphaga litoralis]NYE82089.1 haloacetate dehalogenase [Pigmentiphaga litoralis]